MNANAEVVEPVSWQARLRRSPNALYTEVAGVPVLCDVRDRSVHALNFESVSLWARLDGSPLAETIGSALDSWTDQERRTVLEAIRRFKAVGLIEDAPEGAGTDSVLIGDEVSPAESVRVRGERAGGVLSLSSAPAASELEVSGEDDIDAIELPDDVLVAPNAPPMVEALAGWVRAVVDPDELRRPGVFDALAGFAESIPVQPPPDGIA